MFAALLAALAEAVRGLFGGLGQAIFPRLVAGVALVGHAARRVRSHSDALSCSAGLHPAMKLLQRAAMHQQLFVPACADVQ